MVKLNWIVFLGILLFFFKSNAQNDCTDAIVVCGNSGFQGLTATGFGTQELTGLTTCSSQENNSIWLKLSINSSGTLGFTLIPESTNINVDFDFFIYGSNSICTSLGQSIRCSTTNPQAINQSNNHTGLNSTETDTSEGPGNAGNSFLKWLDVQAGESYYLVIDRPIGTSNFALTWSGTALFNTPPFLNVPTGNGINLKTCDNDGVIDNSTAFNLNQNAPLIIGTQTNVVVQYFGTQNGAITGLNPIVNSAAFVNTTNPQTVFVRITNSLTGCYNNSDFQIEVDNANAFPKSEAFICDDAVDGNDANGRAIFNMNAVSNAIFDNQNITDLSISYHLTQNAASSNTNSLPNLYYNTIAHQQNIFIRATNTAGCSGIKQITLRVNPLPNKLTAALTQCDSGLNPDGFVAFNLQQANISFLNNNPLLTIEYFENNVSLQNDIPLPFVYTNLSNPQNILTKIKNTVTGCFSISNLTLNVNVIPGPILSSLSVCDLINQENGHAKFDLNLVILVTTPTQTVKYYETLNDAILELNAIVNLASYQNINPYLSKIYARIEDDNNCSGISEISLIVNKLPDIELKNSQKYFICSNLLDKFIAIDAKLNSGNPNDFGYKWFFNDVIIPFSTNEISIDKPGIYKVEVSNNNLCTKTRTIEVLESSSASIQNIIIQDITVDNNTITVILASGNGSFEFSLDNPNSNFQDSNIFNFVASGIHIVYVRDKNGCETISKSVSVVGFPKYFTPNGDGFNDFWKVDGINGSFYSKTNIYIFDRFGKLIKDLNALDTNGWNGKLNGEVLPADDYWYSIFLEDGRTARGHFSLKR